MKYQSELIKEIVGTRGHEMSSIHYESECVEKWIEETKGAYPKLCDYQSEWLNYIIENPIGNFPYKTVTNVTDTTVNNVVPYAYKSAILKGQTVVNISSLSGEITIKPGSNKFIDSPLIKQNTTYTFMFNCASVPSTGFIEFRQALDNTALKIENINVVQGYNKFKVMTVNDELNRFRFKNDSTSETDFVFNNLLILEGDYTNQDISYFEGMQSVKMPVLTTMGKNLFGKINKNAIFKWAKSYEWENDVLKLTLNNGGFNAVRFPIKLAKGIYYLSATHNGYSIGFRANNDNDSSLVNPITITKDEEVLIEFMGNDSTIKENEIVEFSNIQPEEGSIATTYEPYKSNILTVNEDVELGSVGEVKDELNLLTGQLTQRTETRAYQEGDESNSEVITDMTNTRYKLPKEVIKTVALNIQDQDGNTLRKIKPIEGTMHIHSDGTPLKPTITMEIPVEATTQNLASFTKEE